MLLKMVGACCMIKAVPAGVAAAAFATLNKQQQ
jgi:hypothetical protein